MGIGKPLERSEKAVREQGIKPCTVAAHENHGRPIFPGTAKFYSWCIAPTGELPRIAEQILKHDLDQPKVGVNAAIRMDNCLYVSVGIRTGKTFQN